MQLTLFSTNLSREVRRKAEKLISRHKNIGAIIESKKIDLEPKMTVNYQASESQRGNQFYSEVEKMAELRESIDEYERMKKKLDYVYDSLNPLQKQIWDNRYLLGRIDIDVYMDMGIPDKKYYQLKREMIAMVAEAFGLM